MLTTDPSTQRRLDVAAGAAVAVPTSASLSCLSCRVAGGVIALPATTVERVADATVQPLFPACPPWIAGLASDVEGVPVLVIRPRGAWRDGTGRVVLVQVSGRVRWGLAIDAVIAVSRESDVGPAVDGWELPEGWLRATAGGGALLVPELVQAHLDTGIAQRGAHG